MPLIFQILKSNVEEETISQFCLREKTASLQQCGRADETLVTYDQGLVLPTFTSFVIILFSTLFYNE